MLQKNYNFLFVNVVVYVNCTLQHLHEVLEHTLSDNRILNQTELRYAFLILFFQLFSLMCAVLKGCEWMFILWELTRVGWTVPGAFRYPEDSLPLLARSERLPSSSRPVTHKCLGRGWSRASCSATAISLGTTIFLPAWSPDLTLAEIAVDYHTCIWN